MKLTICGVRGSTPAPGPHFVRYGGSTSCVALSHEGQRPSLVLDAGTGLTQLTQFLDGEPFVGSILLSHLHWDHTHGIPFFYGGNQPGAKIQLYVPADDPDAVMKRIMSPPHFPITTDELEGEWNLHSLTEGDHEFEGFQVMVREIPHKGGKAFGFRVTDGVRTLTYMSDHSPISVGPGSEGHGEYHGPAMELAKGTDLLIHDAQHTADEFGPRIEWGHSTIEYAIGLGRAAGVGKLMLFHHDPMRTDDHLDAIVAEHSRNGLRIEAAAELTTVDV